MSASATQTQRFVRRTQLAPNEYRKNFRQLDDDVIALVTSPAADQVTPLMSKIYLRLVGAPAHFYERAGVLRFRAELRDERSVTAWAVLCELLGVASATANKALQWLHEQGVIGYFAGKNGVGIRIFLNRAAASIGVRAPLGGEKILPFAPASKQPARTSFGEVAFKDSYAVLENLDQELDPLAPKNGARTSDSLAEIKTRPLPPAIRDPANDQPTRTGPSVISANARDLHELAARLRAELTPALATIADRSAQREHERTREWLEQHGLPKAARVAQREAYNLLRRYGVIKQEPRRTRPAREDAAPLATQATGQPLSMAELEELASTCLAMLEIHGQPIATTLATLSAATGGCLSAAEAEQVQALAEAMQRT